MNRKKSVALILSCAVLIVFAYAGLARVRAQALASNNYGVDPTFLLANCPSGAVKGTYTDFCSTGDAKIYACPSTATNCTTSTASWICIAGCPVSSTTGVKTVNGTAPGATGNVNVSCSGSTPPTTATFSAGSSTSASIAALPVNSTCNGTGS